jgi:hypothetical protein
LGLRDREEDTDFEIIVKNEKGVARLKAHKIILKRCPYFAAMFRMDVQETQKNSVEIPSITEETMKIILDYLYGKEPELTGENVFNIIRGANYLQLNELRIKSVDRFILAFENSNQDTLTKVLKMVDSEFWDMLARKERYDFFPLTDQLLLHYFDEWNNIEDLTIGTLAYILQYSAIAPVVFHVLNEWHKKVQDATILEQLIEIFFKKSIAINLPKMAIKMLSKLEIVDPVILSRFKESNTFSAKKNEYIILRMHNNCWQTFQLEDDALCMVHFLGFKERIKDEKFCIFQFAILKFGKGKQQVTIETKLLDGKKEFIGSWKTNFTKTQRSLTGVLILSHWRKFQASVLDKTVPDQRCCYITFQLVK